MKKIILLFAALSLVSCSDDDSKKEDKYYVDMVVAEIANGPTVTYEFDYNTKKQLVTMTATASASPEIVTMTYEDNRLKTIGYYTLMYEDGVLNSIVSGSQGNQAYPVEYNAAANSYLIDDTNIFLNKYGDIIKYDATEISYDETKKGALSSQSAKNIFLISLLTGVSDMLTFKAVIKDNDYQITNTYDDNGYIKKAVFPAGMYYNTLTYSYTKL